MPPTTETRPEGHIIPGRAELSRYQDDAGVTRADSGRPPRAVGPTHHTGDDRPIAKEDAYYRDAAGIRRIVRGGDRVPLGFELIEDEDKTPETARAPGEPDLLGLQGGGDYAGQNKDVLAAEVERRNADRDEEDQIEVEGTGRDGNVLKDDLVAALEADDEAHGGEGDDEGDEG